MAKAFWIAVAVFSLLSGPAAAQDRAADAAHFPNRPIHIVVPFPAGGPTDLITRFIGQRMTEHWGQPVIVENRAGGNTIIGAQIVQKAEPDGYTLLAAMDVTMIMNPLTNAHLAYDPFKDFTPVTLMAKNISLLVVRADGPKTAKELIAKAKANPGKLNMGAGTLTSRLGALLFAKTAGIDVQLIPFKGSADIDRAVLSGSIDFALDSLASALPQVRAGRFRALGKYSTRPIPALPDLPSLADAAGLPTLGESSTWAGLIAPAGTPRAITEKIAAEVARIYADPAAHEKLEKAGLFAVASKPGEFDAFMRSETVRWSKVFRDNNGLQIK